MCSNIKADIAASINDIDNLLETYSLLLELSKQKEPDAVELAAIATILHSFYNGIEGIFILIAKALDDGVSNESQWHRALLRSMNTGNAQRLAVISDGLLLRLGEYMQFRHFFRHAYAFRLSWARMQPLAALVCDIWDETKSELTQWMDASCFPFPTPS